MAEEFEEYEEIELEYSEDDVLYYIYDENDEEIGLALTDEDGNAVEYYYEGFDAADYETVEIVEEIIEYVDEADEELEEDDEPKEKSYLQKLATIAGAETDKAREKANKKLDKVRAKAEVGLDKAGAVATTQAKKAKAQAKKTAEDMGFGVSPEEIAETTTDLNEIARESALTAKELKEAYDDIMGSFGFLKKK